MYFPIPIPFDSEYPVILNRCDPLTVSVNDIDDVVAGGADDGDADDEQFENGLADSLRILPMLNANHDSSNVSNLCGIEFSSSETKPDRGMRKKKINGICDLYAEYR